MKTLSILLLSVTAALAQTTPPTGMAVIPAGVYRPLFRSVTDLKEVPIKAFCLDLLPVTNSDYLEFVRANPRWRRSQVKRIFADESYLKNWAGDLELGRGAPTNVPVTYVSWFAAKSYAQWKNKRLPTVAEWECAAAAFPKDPSYQREMTLWYATASPAELAPVGRGATNRWGVHDLHGLVWEWVADFNTAMVTGDARGDNGLERELFCGAGSANAQDVSNYPAFMRYGFRSSLKAPYTVHNLGFRCARDL